MTQKEDKYGVIYKGDFEVLYSIPTKVTNLIVNSKATSIFGDESIPCSQYVKKTLQSITFEANPSLQTIQQFAFYQCTGLTSLDFSTCRSLTRIERKAFSECRNIVTLIFPNSSLSFIGESAFSSLKITELFVPSSVSSLGTLCFANSPTCTSLSLSPEIKLRIFEKSVFSSLGITYFLIPKSITYLHPGFCLDCSKLLIVEVESGNSAYCIVNYSLFDTKKTQLIMHPFGRTGHYDVPQGTRSIGHVAFIGSLISTVTFPPSLYNIEFYSFTGSHLTELVIPDTVTMMGLCAFSGCKFINTVKLSKNCLSLPSSAFNDCRFSKIEIPEGITYIGDNCFSSNPNLKEIILPTTLKELGGNVFPILPGLNISFSEGSNLKIDENYLIMDKNETFISQYLGTQNNFKLNIPSTIKTIKNQAFSSKNNIISIEFPIDSQIETIETLSFYSCTKLESINFPDSLQEIQSQAFEFCSGLRSISFGSNFVSIGEKCFRRCNQLENVTMKTSVLTNLPKYLFSDCYQLQNILIPENIKTIDDHCFYKCYQLQTFEFPKHLEYIGSYSFSETSIIKVQFYETCILNSINRYCFYNCCKLITVEFSQFISHIGIESFSYTNITILNLSSSINVLDSSCFKSCLQLHTFYIPSTSQLNTSGFGIGIFEGCSSLRNIESYSPNFVNYIGSLFTPDKKQLLLFPPASNIEHFSLPESVENIGSGAFFGCKNLLTIMIPSHTIRSIGTSAFEGCSRLHWLNIPKEVEHVGFNAFKDCSSLKCGIDVSSKDPTFINDLISKSLLPRSSLKSCSNICSRCRCNSQTRSYNILFISAFISIKY